MRNMYLVVLGVSVILGIIVIFSCGGCATNSGPFGSSSGIGINRDSFNSDPTMPVDPGQVAYKGIDGASGPYAGALAIGNIKDPEARRDALEAMKTISENETNGVWGYRGHSGRGFADNDNPPAILGMREDQAFGRIENSFRYPVKVFIRGMGSPYVFGPGEELELAVPHGRYDIALYNVEQGTLIGKKSFTTRRRTRQGDTTYDFRVRLD